MLGKKKPKNIPTTLNGEFNGDEFDGFKVMNLMGLMVMNLMTFPILVKTPTKKQRKVIPYHPWDWYIYLHLVEFYGINVGKYTVRPMDASWVWLPTVKYHEFWQPTNPWIFNNYLGQGGDESKEYLNTPWGSTWALGIHPGP